jgi:hypothetical protein
MLHRCDALVAGLWRHRLPRRGLGRSRGGCRYRALQDGNHDGAQQLSLGGAPLAANFRF